MEIEVNDNSKKRKLHDDGFSVLGEKNIIQMGSKRSKAELNSFICCVGPNHYTSCQTIDALNTKSDELFKHDALIFTNVR